MKRFLIVGLFLSFKYCIALSDKSEELSHLVDAVYIISLDRTPERLNFVKKQLDSLGIKSKHFPAVDGKYIIAQNLTTHEKFYCNDIIKVDFKYVKNQKFKISCSRKIDNLSQAEFIYKTDIRKLIPGECGCYMSHRGVWADVIKNKYKRVIIFEDDIILFDNFKENLVNFLKHIPNDSDVAFLDIGMNRPFAEKTYFVSAGF